MEVIYETRLCVIHATETWIEYINRLVELWLGFFLMAIFY
jgi:hypothetical protein